jgi:DnaJ-class molecular chaperone with C-terminal Zn finger domain
MDYFKLLKIPQKLKIDHNELKKNYHNLIRHKSKDPVLCAQSAKKPSAKEKQRIQEAFETLSDRITRIEHLLELKGHKVANDNRPPVFFRAIAQEIEGLLKAKQTKTLKKDRLKALHQEVLLQFSTVSIDLDRLEKAWDESVEQDLGLLKKLKRKTAAYSYIREVEQELRTALG